MDLMQKLGFDPHDRVAIVHVDDIGMSHPANVGAVRALDGAATCASIMMPCPGFAEIVEIARQRQELDLGVHLTVNSEFPGFRWGPARDDVPSLCRDDGSMWSTTRETVANADPDEVAREIRSQIEAVLEAGVDATHIDCHMGTLIDRKFFADYLQTGIEYNLPVLMARSISAGLLDEHGIRLPKDYQAQVDDMEERGFAVVDYIEGQTPWYNPFTAEAHHLRRIESGPDGLTYFILHAAEGSDELRTFAPDWLQRHEEHRLFSDGTIERGMDAAGIKRIGMRELRDQMRNA